MAKLTAEFPELSPATILSLAVMGHNSGESVRGFSPFQWSYGKGYEPGDYADRHFMGLDGGSASEFARRQGLRDAAEAAFKKSKAEEKIGNLVGKKA